MTSAGLKHLEKNKNNNLLNKCLIVYNTRIGKVISN